LEKAVLGKPRTLVKDKKQKKKNREIDHTDLYCPMAEALPDRARGPKFQGAKSTRSGQINHVFKKKNFAISTSTDHVTGNRPPASSSSLFSCSRLEPSNLGKKGTYTPMGFEASSQ
jgi:hypothetical protein